MVEPSVDNSAFQQQFERAQSAASQANCTEPRAISAAYDSVLGLVIIHLQSGAIFSFPVARYSNRHRKRGDRLPSSALPCSCGLIGLRGG